MSETASNDSNTFIRAFFDAVNTSQIDQIRPYLAEDIVVHTPIPGFAPGRQGFEAFMGLYYSAVPVQHIEVKQVVTQGDRVAVLHTHHLTHGGEFAGIAPTGKSVSIEGLELYRISGGQVAEMWHHDDLLSLLQQLAPERFAAPSPPS
jgi:predicted ester cyclase